MARRKRDFVRKIERCWDVATAKKQLSYANERRNGYGENTKSSRKNIPLRRARKHRQYRHAVKQVITIASDIESVESDVAEVRRDGWQKASDISLADFILRQKRKRVRSGQQPA